MLYAKIDQVCYNPTSLLISPNNSSEAYPYESLCNRLHWFDLNVSRDGLLWGVSFAKSLEVTLSSHQIVVYCDIAHFTWFRLIYSAFKLTDYKKSKHVHSTQ